MDKDIIKDNIEIYEQGKYPSWQVKRSVVISELISFFVEVNQPGFVFKGESHDFWEVVIVIDGNAVICDDTKMYKLGKGNAFIHRPNVFHAIRNDGKEPLAIGIFSFKGILNASVEDKVFKVSDELLDTYINARFQAGEAFDFIGVDGGRPIYIKRAKPYKEFLQQMIISKLECIVASIVRGIRLKFTDKHTLAEENYLRIVDVMSNNIRNQLTIEEIALKSEMSVSNAKRIFAKYAGCGIMVCYNGLIVSEAKKRLLEGYSISEVAEEFGFNNQSYFSSFFKRITGKSPTEWKKEIQ